MKKLSLTLLVFLLAACGSTTRGQVVFHWDRYNTGGLKFARDHSECMREAEAFKLLPNFKSWFYTEEQRYNMGKFCSVSGGNAGDGQFRSGRYGRQPS